MERLCDTGDCVLASCRSNRSVTPFYLLLPTPERHEAAVIKGFAGSVHAVVTGENDPSLVARPRHSCPVQAGLSALLLRCSLSSARQRQGNRMVNP